MTMRRTYIEDEHGNGGYLPECHGLCNQGRSVCSTPTTCRSKPTRMQHLIVGALAVMLVAWLAWQFLAGIAGGVKS
jgi:hypothetical protein